MCSTTQKRTGDAQIGLACSVHGEGGDGARLSELGAERGAGWYAVVVCSRVAVPRAVVVGSVVGAECRAHVVAARGLAGGDGRLLRWA